MSRYPRASSRHRLPFFPKGSTAEMRIFLVASKFWNFDFCNLPAFFSPKLLYEKETSKPSLKNTLESSLPNIQCWRWNAGSSWEMPEISTGNPRKSCLTNRLGAFCASMCYLRRPACTPKEGIPSSNLAGWVINNNLEGQECKLASAWKYWCQATDLTAIFLLFFAENNLTKILYTGSLPFLPALSRENPERTTASMVDDPYDGVPAAHNNAD